MWMGWKGEVIIDELNNNSKIGRNYAYKSVVISPRDVHRGSSNLYGQYSLGTEIKAQIYDYSDYSLKGTPTD
jgi:hypothetical protein